MNRRHFLLHTAFAGVGLSRGAAAFAADGASAGGEPFDFDRLVDRAARLAAADHVPAKLRFEGDYAALTYDQYRDIRFRREADPLLSSGAPFGMDLLPPGFLFDTPVEVSLVVDGVARPLAFSLDPLDIGPLAPTPANADALAWSGFRLRSPINRPDVMDEVAVFQGASYFRAVASGQRYGLSARGLAIDMADERGEEFPAFTAFWIEVPPDDATSIAVFALLDSPSVAGAYRFDVQPGAETVMRIKSVLFPRRDLDDVGIAPLTSMFLFDPSNGRRFDDYRPAVHDSDGLQMINGRNERLFRSLANPVRLQVSSFVDENPTAFGLVQRHRRFDDYEDDEARYELRPGAWVQPAGKWGAGHVELVEIPSDAEIHDNISAFWRPSGVLRAGQRQQFDYRLSWTGNPLDDVPLARVLDVRSGTRAGASVPQFVVDLGALDAAAMPPRIDLTATRGELANVAGKTLEANGNYRVSFDFDPGDASSADLRLQLQGPTGPASETWIYRWTS